MSTNDNFNSKKIMEEIENLENDPENKKKTKKSKVTSFFETLILNVMIISVVAVVIAQFIEEVFVEYGDETDYQSDYSSVDSIYDDYSDATEETSNLMTIEEFMNSELGNKLLAESVKNKENETTNTVNEPTVENTIVDEGVTNTEENLETEEIIEEEPIEEYDQDAVLKQKFEEQKKNLLIAEEGTSLNKELIISLENKNAELMHELWVYTVFYQNNNIVAIDTQDIDVIVPNNKKYLKIEEMPGAYENYEVFVTKYSYGDYNNTILNDGVGYSSYVENELVEIEIKNNSEKKINKANFTILYYDSYRNLLDIDNVSDFSIRKNGKGSATGYGVWDESLEKYIEYDEYEVILDYAVYYN